MKACFALAACSAAAIVCSQGTRPKLEGPLSIAAAIQLAEQNNPSLSAARSQVQAASAGVRSARSAFAPQVSANSFATSGSYSSIISSSPGVMPPYWLVVPNGGFLDQSLMLMLPLFTGGRLQAGVNSASWQQRAAEGELLEARADVALRVQDAYLKALAAKQMVAVQEAKVAAAQELLRTTQAQFEAGKGIEASVQRVQAELSHAQRRLTGARNEVAKALLDLDEAIGADFDSSITLTDDLSLTMETGTLGAYIETAMASRGRLLAARARAEAATAEIRAAEGQRSPQLYGQAMGDVASRRMGSGTTFGLTLSIPIFDGGRISADVVAAKAQRAKAQAELADVTLAVEKEVRQAWLDVETAKANAASAETSIKAAQSAYEVVALRVSAEKAILVEQLDALQALAEARADLAQAIYEHNIAIAKLVRAAGGAR